MNGLKKDEMIRKRNAELTKQLEDIKFQLEFNSQLNMNGYKKAKDLINELEHIKQEWEIAIRDLHEKKEKYDLLISDLQEMKKIMANMGFKIPWYKRIIKNRKDI